MVFLRDPEKGNKCTYQPTYKQDAWKQLAWELQSHGILGEDKQPRIYPR